MSGEQILIVEDQRTVAGAMRTRLRGLGYDVAGIACSGKEAVEKAEELLPDLVLMDIRLGEGMDGIEAARLIRTQLDIPIVYVSAYADQEIINRAKLTDPAGFINKPFTTKDLLTAIDLALYSRGRRRGETPVASELVELPPALVQAEGVITSNLDGNIIFVSQSAERLTGKQRRDLTGQPIARVLQDLYGLEAVDAQAIVAEVLANGTARQFAERRTPDGEVMSQEDTLSALSDAHGKYFGVALKLSATVAAPHESRLLEQAAALGIAFEPLPLGVVLVSRQLRVLYSNGRAKQLLAERAGLECTAGKLWARDSAVRSRLDELVESAAAAEPNMRPTPVGVIQLGEPGSDRPVELLVVPARTGDDLLNSPAAILYLFDATQPLVLSVEILGSLYGLTEAETRLVALMLEGLTIEDAAARLESSPATARAQLKQIFHKMGVNRQWELIQRLQRGPAATVFQDIE